MAACLLPLAAAATAVAVTSTDQLGSSDNKFESYIPNLFRLPIAK